MFLVYTFLMKSHPIVTAVIVILVLGAALAFVAGRPNMDVPVVTTFEECAANYPVMESYPRQCQTPDGRFFTEVIEEPAATTSQIPDLITVDLASGAKVSSPLVLSGSARGTWYFEASFPIEIKDANGNTIGQGYAEAQGEWMTENFVQFKSVPITFAAQPAGSKGTIVFMKDNPSALPENDMSLEVPVTF